MTKSILSLAAVGAVAISAASGQIPPGYEIVQITDDPDHDHDARINNCGEIVFAKRIDQIYDREEIFLYDNGALFRVTDDNVQDRFPDINDAGTIVWTREADGFGGGTVTRYEDGAITELFTGYSPEINNLGHVAFVRYNGEGCSQGDANIFFYDGNTVQQITEDATSHQAVAINDHDELVWARYDFCVSPWESSIMLYSGGVIWELPSADTEPQNAKINNLGQVAWNSTYENGDRFIELWEDGVTVTLTGWGSGPKLNKLGEIGFHRWYDETDTGRLWLYRPPDEFIQITDGSLITGCQDINDMAEMALYLNFGYPDRDHTDIGILRRVRRGEADFDGDVDADDYATLAACMTGPVDIDRLCECRFLDLDHDRDVDLGDFAAVQNWFTGQN